MAARGLINSTDGTEIADADLRYNNISASSAHTSDYLATDLDGIIVINAASNSVEILLPASPITSKIYNIACINSTFPATINFNSKNFYDSATDEKIFKGENLTIQYDGTRWIGA